MTITFNIEIWLIEACRSLATLKTKLFLCLSFFQLFLIIIQIYFQFLLASLFPSTPLFIIFLSLARLSILIFVLVLFFIFDWWSVNTFELYFLIRNKMNDDVGRSALQHTKLKLQKISVQCWAGLM